jgi:predicted acetyltransferase
MLRPAHPSPGDTQPLAALWQEIFRDSAEFTGLFFSRVYRPENALVLKRDNRIMAALQMIPYEIKAAGRILPAAYLCGICTRPSERGKGFMHLLMTEAVEIMCRRGYRLSMLIPAEPWLFDVYRRFGYTFPICRAAGMYAPAGGQPPFAVPDYAFVACTAEEYFPYFDRKQRERSCAVLHNARDLETILRDLACDGGHAWVALENRVPVGIVFAKPESGGKIIIKELVCDHASAKEALTLHALNAFNARTAEIRLPPSGAEQSVYGLARLLDRQIPSLSRLHMTLMLD